jgi:hypothetical protein
MARNAFLVLVACWFGLAWLAASASAQFEGQEHRKIGVCNSIVAKGAGLVGQINQGIGDVGENCFDVLVGLLEFVDEGCLPPEEGGVVPFGSLYIQKISLIAPDTPALQNVCSAVVETCGIPLLICNDE